MHARVKTEHVIHDAQPIARFNGGALWVTAEVESIQLTLFMDLAAALTLQYELAQAIEQAEAFIKAERAA